MNRLDILSAELRSTDSAAELLRSLSKAAAMVMVTMAQEGEETDIKPFTIIWASSKACEIFGYLDGELDRKPLELLIPASVHGSHSKHTSGFSANPRPRAMGLSSAPLHGRRRDGTEIALQISLSPMVYARLRVCVATIIESRPESHA